MLHRRAITTLALIAIPVALFVQIPMESSFIRTATNVTAASLIFFAWHLFNSRPISRINKLLACTYLIGFLTFSIWLSLNLVVRDTYEASWRNTRDASIRHFCLAIELPLVYFGAALAVLFAILCTIKIFTTARDHNRHNKSLKATNV